MMGKFLLTFVRHGETEYNVMGLMQGQTDIPLNDNGLAQADALGRYLAHERFDRIYSSDLARCMQTANGVIRHAQVPRPEIIQDPRLREKSFGSFEGKTSQEYRAHADRTGISVPPGGETSKQVVNRGLSFLRDMCKDVHKTYSLAGELKSPMATDSPHRGAATGGDENSEFEIIFEGSGDEEMSAESSGTLPGNDDSSMDTTDITTYGTTIENRCIEPSSLPDLCSSSNKGSAMQNTTPNEVGGTTLEEDRPGAAPRVNAAVCGSSESIFASLLTGANRVPACCPHVLVSSHGHILRVVLQRLQRNLKICIPGGAGLLWRHGYPNTGLSSFVVELEGDGSLSDMECLFLYRTDHFARLSQRPSCPRPWRRQCDPKSDDKPGM